MTVQSTSNHQRTHLADPQSAAKAVCGVRRTDWTISTLDCNCGRCLKIALKRGMDTGPQRHDRMAATEAAT